MACDAPPPKPAGDCPEAEVPADVEDATVDEAPATGRPAGAAVVEAAKLNGAAETSAAAPNWDDDDDDDEGADSEAAEDDNDATAADDDVPGGAPADAVIEDRRAPAIEAPPPVAPVAPVSPVGGDADRAEERVAGMMTCAGGREPATALRAPSSGWSR